MAPSCPRPPGCVYAGARRFLRSMRGPLVTARAVERGVEHSGRCPRSRVHRNVSGSFIDGSCQLFGRSESAVGVRNRNELWKLKIHEELRKSSIELVGRAGIREGRPILTSAKALVGLATTLPRTLTGMHAGTHKDPI
eukprot:8191098-Pyramimonas_sp.AAC.2